MNDKKRTDAKIFQITGYLYKTRRNSCYIDVFYVIHALKGFDMAIVLPKSNY